jgi:tetratricopeptide (TPR) repeat protein
MMAYCYDDIGNLDEAILAIDKYIEVAPGEANPYDSKGQILMENGRLKGAIEAFEKAVEIKPDLYHSIKDLGILYIFDRQYDKAENCFQILASGKSAAYRTDGRRFLPFIPLYQGKFQEALQVLDDAFAADRIEKELSPDPATLKYSMQLYIYYQQGDYDRAVAYCEYAMGEIKKLRPSAFYYLRDLYIALLVKQGNISKAEEVAEDLRQEIEASGSKMTATYWFSLGIIEFEKINYDQSVEYLSKSDAMREGVKSPRSFITSYWLALALQKAGRNEDAVIRFEKLLKVYDEHRLFWATASVKIHYYLGRAYEELDRNEDAINQYHLYLDAWKNADDGREKIEDTQNRLTRLES